MAKNETMIAMMLAFIAPIIASLGEKESIRSFLMGTDGPSMVQIIAGGALLVVATGVLIKGTVKIAYDSFVSERSQIYATLPISLRDVALIKTTVLSINMLIMTFGLTIGTTLAWLFGNNGFINFIFEVVITLVNSGEIEKMILIPICLLATIVLVFFVNELIFSGFGMIAISSNKAKGDSAKAKAVLGAVVYVVLIGGVFIKTCAKLLHYVAINYIESLWIYVLGITGVIVALGLIGFGICVFKLNNEYYL